MAAPTTTSPRKKSAAKKSSVKKTATPQRAAAKPSATRKKGAAKETGAPTVGAKRRYSRATSDTVRTEMEEMHAGKLRSGSSGKNVTNPKQAIAIALSEARRSGKKVPPNPNRAKAEKSR